MIEKPLVTVITVCYNAVSLIEKTIRSVLAQQYEHIEYVVVDGVCDDIFHHSRHGLRLFVRTLSLLG